MKVLNVLVRIYLQPEQLDAAITFYEDLFSTTCQRRFSHALLRLELAQVGSMLLIAGTDEALESVKKTQLTYSVDSVAEFEEYLKQHGAKILSSPKPVPTGFNMLVRHPDACIVEYVESCPHKHRPNRNL